MTQTSLSFHNTTDLIGDEKEKHEEKAKSQDDDVLALFDSPYKRTLTPETALRVLKHVKPEKYANVPLTSIRRAFSNLKRRTLIEKTKVKILGDYGKKVSCWSLVGKDHEPCQ